MRVVRSRAAKARYAKRLDDAAFLLRFREVGLALAELPGDEEGTKA